MINQEICLVVDRLRFNLIYLERKERRDPPKFSDQLTDVTVFEGIFNILLCLFFPNLFFFSSGSTAKLRCEVKGKPTPKIEWLKNGEVKHYRIVEKLIKKLF